MAPCKSNPGARPRAKVLDPELLASARLFAPASPAVAAALGRYEAAPGAASRDALRGALRAFWATEAGRQALLRAQRGGSAFGKYVKSQETGEGRAVRLLAGGVGKNGAQSTWTGYQSSTSSSWTGAGLGAGLSEHFRRAQVLAGAAAGRSCICLLSSGQPRHTCPLS